VPGQTTLVSLMMRFYELDAGRITLDGVDVTSVPRRELRSRMGMVLQDTWLFGGTIRDNIAYGRPSASEDEILEAARATYVDRFVRSLPDGYDTVLDDEGANVSAGEKQLLTIARAFLARPSFVIAHRLCTIRDADSILVIEANRTVEQGTPASLLAAGAAYARLYEAQFVAPAAEI
jgi:ATP-binding cassette subfamily B multidrug efflux pump